MIITLLFIILFALHDNGKRFTDHKQRFMFRAIVVALISYFSEGNFIINFAQNTAIFYLIFDYALNILEGRKWNYVGSTSKIDQFINKYGSWKIQFIIKISLVAVAFALKLK